MGNQTGEQAKTPEPGLFKRIFHHPTFGAWAGIVGIITGIFGVYAYYASVREPNLTYYISPTRTPIVQKGNLNNFSVTFWGKEIKGDLSAAEIQIWNGGKAPILGTDISSGGDIEQQISIKTPNGEPIYQETITPSREVIGASDLGITNHLSGIVPIGWRILEKNDGIKIQLIYGGSVALPLIIEGEIKGQRQGIIHYSQSNSQHPKQDLILSGIQFGIIIFMFIRLKSIASRDSSGKRFRFLICFLIVILSIGLIASIIPMYLVLSELKPPCGF